MKQICIRLESDLMRQIERDMEEFGALTKAEFIRETLRSFIATNEMKRKLKSSKS